MYCIRLTKQEKDEDIYTDKFYFFQVEKVKDKDDLCIKKILIMKQEDLDKELSVESKLRKKYDFKKAFVKKNIMNKKGVSFSSGLYIENFINSVACYDDREPKFFSFKEAMKVFDEYQDEDKSVFLRFLEEKAKINIDKLNELQNDDVYNLVDSCIDVDRKSFKNEYYKSWRSKIFMDFIRVERLNSLSANMDVIESDYNNLELISKVRKQVECLEYIDSNYEVGEYVEKIIDYLINKFTELQVKIAENKNRNDKENLLDNINSISGLLDQDKDPVIQPKGDEQVDNAFSSFISEEMNNNDNTSQVNQHKKAKSTNCLFDKRNKGIDNVSKISNYSKASFVSATVKKK